MQQRFSFYVLVATVVAVGVLFFHVVQPFLLPLFLAAVLALLFRPLQKWCLKLTGGRSYAASAMVTATVGLLGLLPLTAALFLAGQELFAVGEDLLEVDWREQPVVADALELINEYAPRADWEAWRKAGGDAVRGVTQEVYDRTTSLLSNVIAFVVGLSIVMLGLFYFLAEGPAILKTLQQISPLEDDDEAELFEQFDRVCRSVVVASVACALAQAVLAGIGFAVLGIDRVWLLSGLTMVCALIPFLGSAVVWVGVCIWLASQGSYAAAVGLAIYGTAIVSTADNLIRAYVIHGGASLHPLVALISVLGALRVVGLWGVFIGPIVAAFFYALLKILQQRMHQQDAG